MKPTELRGKTVKALKELAAKLGIKKALSGRKDELIESILSATAMSASAEKSDKSITPRKPSARNQPAAARETPPVDDGKPVKKSSKTIKLSPSRRRASQASPPTGIPPLAKPPEPADPIAEIAAKTVPVVTMSAPISYDDLGELPESYGSGRLFFAARDPWWIYAYWDFSWQQMDDMRRHASYGELKLRVHQGKDSRGSICQEVTINPAARNWFVKVEPNTDYYAEFGFYNHEGQFQTVSRSRPTRTPSDRMSDHKEARFVTIPFWISFRELFALVKGHFKDGEELLDVIYRLQKAGFRFPFDYEGVNYGEGLDEEALIRMFGGDLFRRIRMGSDVLTEWLQRRVREETSSAIFSLSSPFGASFGAQTERGFWFKVNAELIVYGATEPNAKVMFDGKSIALKPDGTFRFQFALPDGKFALPAAATSADGVETREVHLNFVRNTARKGDVGVVPHPKDLVEPTRA